MVEHLSRTPAAASGIVRAYDVTTGAVVWERPTPASSGAPGPVVMVAGDLWVSSGTGCSGVLSKLDPATGNVLATETTGPALVGAFVASGSTVASVRNGCVTDRRPQLVVRDLVSPAANWTFAFPDDALMTPPSISHDKISTSRTSGRATRPAPSKCSPPRGAGRTSALPRGPQPSTACRSAG
jgi:outer membrane protein assembly factor BamB